MGRLTKPAKVRLAVLAIIILPVALLAILASELASSTSAQLSVLAGNGTSGTSAAGIPAPLSQLATPMGITMDRHGNLYIADSGNNRIEELAAKTHHQFGIAMLAQHLYTVAGDGHAGDMGLTGPATRAMLNFPTGVAVDQAGDLFIAGAATPIILEVPNHSGMQFGEPMQSGHIYPVAGRLSEGYQGDGITATDARLQGPVGIATDAKGNLYIADSGNNCVQEVAATTHTQYGIRMREGYIYTLLGPMPPPGSAKADSTSPEPLYSGSMSFPVAVAVDSQGDLFVAELYGNKIVEVPSHGGTQFGQAMLPATPYQIAGGGRSSITSTGEPALGVGLGAPVSLATDPEGNLYIASYNTSEILELVRETHKQNAVEMGAGDIYTLAGPGDQGIATIDGTATPLRLSHPVGVATATGATILISDYYTNCIFALDEEPTRPATTS